MTTSARPSPRPERPSRWQPVLETGRGALIVLAAATLIWFLLRYTLLAESFAWALPYGGKTAWYLTRSTGVVAYLFLTGSTMWGILLSTKYVREQVPAPVSLEMHRLLSWLTAAWSATHAFLLLFDTYYVYTLRDLLVPFVGPYRPVDVAWGIIALYVLVLVNVSFGWRQLIGANTWRRVHYLTFVVFGLVTWHGWAAGTDTALLGMRLLYGGSTAVVLFLTNYRIITAVQAKRTAASAPARP